MKYLITGCDGQLGFDIVRELQARGTFDFFMGTHINMDITNKNIVNNVIDNFKPDVIIHCAAYTHVDQAEEEKEKCFAINVEGTKNVIEAAKKIHAKLLFISTDYVFDGEKIGYYDINDIPNPINIYGQSKFLAECEVLKYSKSFIIRVSWLFGIHGGNFVKTMLNLSKTKRELNVIDDQIGSPTYTKDLAKSLIDISVTNKFGIYHVTNENTCSWADFASEIFKLTNTNIVINRISSSEYPSISRRPKNSKLSKQSLINNGFTLLPSWQDAVKRYLKELESGKK